MRPLSFALVFLLALASFLGTAGLVIPVASSPALEGHATTSSLTSGDDDDDDDNDDDDDDDDDDDEEFRSVA